jgi:ADP-ribose pyrophosphatase YjhB (NUDIX family)
MKVKDTEISIVQADTLQQKVDYVVPNLTGVRSKEDQEKVRVACARGLRQAALQKAQSIAIPALGCEEGNFPPVGSAKIIVQEIMSFLRDDRSLKQIAICLPNEELFTIFEKHATRYIKHTRDKLGPGPYVTVDIIIELPQGIVIIERSNPPYGWALPGGFVDYGESLEQAAVREAKEETNLDLFDLRQMRTYSEPGRDPRFQTIATVFIAKANGEPRHGDDAGNLKIVPYEKLLKEDYAFDHKKIIKDYLVQRRV